jgi:hypothetical protein
MLEDGLGVVVDPEHGVELRHLLRMAGVLAQAVDSDVDVLEADRRDDDEEGEELARAAGGEPAVNPGEDHAGEQHVGDGKGEGRGVGGWRERWPGDGDARGGGEEGQRADDGGGAEKAEEEADEEISGEVEREADEGFRVEGEAGWGDVDADNYLQDEDAPEDTGEEAEVAVVDRAVAGGERTGDDG